MKNETEKEESVLTDEEIVDRDREERRWRVELAHDDVMREEYAPARSYTGARYLIDGKPQACICSEPQTEAANDTPCIQCGLPMNGEHK